MEDILKIDEFLKPRNIGGCGYGDGSGYGYGDGDGSGYGYGYGYGVKEFEGDVVYTIDGVPTIIDRIRGDYAQGRILCKDFTTEACYVARVGNCYAHGRTLKQAHRDAEEKALTEMPIEDRIRLFRQQFPSLSSTAKCAELYQWHHILTGSCTMGRDEFVKAHGLSMDKDYAISYFLEITANAYGGNIIKQLKGSYENETTD